jgi:hypothetical protein
MLFRGLLITQRYVYARTTSLNMTHVTTMTIHTGGSRTDPNVISYVKVIIVLINLETLTDSGAKHGHCKNYSLAKV